MKKSPSLSMHIEPKFNRAANITKRAHKRPSPISIRFSDCQLKDLERHANGQSIGRYIKDYVLDGHRIRAKSEISGSSKDYEALARLLRVLGQSELRTYLCALYELAKAGQFVTDDETTQGLKKAFIEITAMRNDLIAALGLRARKGE